MLNKKQSALIKLLSIMLLVSIIFTFQTSTVLAGKDAPVTIEYFYSSTSSSNSAYNIPAGTTVLLNYKVLNAASVEIKGLEKEPECFPPIEGSIEAWPMTTTTYTLYAYDPAGNVKGTKSFTVYVNTSSIEKFTATPDKVEPEGNVKLDWEGFYASKVTISGPEYNKTFDYKFNPDTLEGYAFSGSTIVKPKATSVYTISATGLDGKTVKKDVTVNVYKPSILYFNSDKTSIGKGETVNLSWEVKYAKYIQIYGIEKEPEETLPLKGSYEVWPSVTTTYILEAYGYDDKLLDSKSITVTVNNPKVEYFKSNVNNVLPGKNVTLSWKTSFAQAVKLNGEVVSLEGSKVVATTASTVYKLEVMDFTGSVVSTVELPINVVKINAFKADKTSVNYGEKVNLTWDVSNAASVKINGTTVNSVGSLEVLPTTQNQLYTITVYDSQNDFISKDILVSINAPQVEKFKAEPEKIVLGDSSTISWKVLGAKEVKFNGTVVGSEGSQKVTPTSTTTYTLEVTDISGKIIQKQVTVTVLPLEVTTFVADKYTISKSQLVKLSWTTRNAVSCKIVADTGAQLPNRPVNGSVSVTPNKTITYTLIATDAYGNTAKKSLTITVQ